MDVNGVVFAELARACGSASEWEAMLSITGQMRTKGFAPDALVLASASNAYQKAENLPRLLLALVELDARTTSLCQPRVGKEGSGCTCHVRVVRSQPRTRQHATQHAALGLDLLGSKPCAAPPVRSDRCSELRHRNNLVGLSTLRASRRRVEVDGW